MAAPIDLIVAGNAIIVAIIVIVVVSSLMAAATTLYLIPPLNVRCSTLHHPTPTATAPYRS